jgi:hypothetical protein
MTWTRLDDSWVDDQVLEELDHGTRWHYLALIQFCSRNSRYDGVMRIVDARRCSDIDDPATAIALLAGAGLLEIEDSTVRVVRIEQHIPPPHMRDENRKARQRTEKRRSRLHRAGDHSECLPANCPKAGPADVSADVSTDPGTGQDGPGQEVPPPVFEADETNEPHGMTCPCSDCEEDREWLTVGAAR